MLCYTIEKGKSVRVADVWIEQIEGTTTYNLHVEEIDILVHNAFPCGANNGGLGVLTTLRGSGPVPGVIEVSQRTKSVAAIKNFFPKQGSIEFVFDLSTNTFVVGLPKSGLLTLESPHQSLVRVSGTNPKKVVGGTFKRGENGLIITDENSGHFGHRWNDKNRKQFREFLEEKLGVKIEHQVWQY